MARPSKIPFMLVVVTAFFAVLGVAQAQDLAPRAQEARFILTETPQGIMRLDQADGTVSYCEERNGKLICTPSADAILAYEAEIAALERENKQLREDLAQIGEQLRNLAEMVEAKRAGPVVEQPQRTEKDGWLGPDEEEKLDQAFDFTEKAMRRFFNMIEGLRQDFDNPGAVPQTTPEEGSGTP
ncbi:hypothetical protein [Pseudovibrio exalbescens]|nr:hypothetical protein [Pseudovibrio exalbescens]